MSSDKITIFLVHNSGELQSVSTTEPDKTYLVRDPSEQTIVVMKSGEGRAGFMASRIANQLRHEEKGMRYRVQVVEPDERQLYLDILKDKEVDTTDVSALSVQSPALAVGDGTIIGEMKPEETPTFLTLEHDLPVEEVKPVTKVAEPPPSEEITTPIVLDTETINIITHLCGAYLLDAQKAALQDATVSLSITEKHRLALREKILKKIDDFLWNILA